MLKCSNDIAIANVGVQVISYVYAITKIALIILINPYSYILVVII